ncbi:glycine betaine ABC transporter substrate-binding protein [Pseudonocardia nigra]|uniref:glycine betaine ABC transporter substrate-binding protein n=1 Tax=Pseudonocardia nigra TaxID=1921578 RepID=UPI0027E36E53|nr:glycine betaine ABC transporter substrate-binding protein [Pseudonocardia nigra]
MTALPRRRRAGPFLALLLAAAMAVTGCATDPAAGVTVKAVQFPWSAAQLTTAILGQVTATHPELGVARLDPIQVGTSLGWAGAQRGDVDLLSEVAMPNQEELAAAADERMNLVSQTYDDAEQGWFVPTYATQPGQPLEGLTSVTQLNDYAEALGGRLVDAAPSFITTGLNAKRLAGYGLELEQVTSSEAAQLAELRRAYEAREPILVFLYHPHWVFAEFDMTKLDEPTPYSPECFTTSDGACSLPPYSAWTADSEWLRQEAPAFHAMLERFRLPIPDIEAMLKAVDLDNEDVEDVAARYLAEHPDRVAEWLGENA